MKTPLSALAAALLALPAFAHVSLQHAKAPAGSTYKAVFGIGHGCAGSPTTAVAVRMPAGFRGAKPMPKAGWTLSIVREPLAEPYDSHGRKVTDDVVEVRWTADASSYWLADAHFDEFVVRGQLPARAGPLWFKLRQTCEQGSWDWSQVPGSGTSTRGLKTPAVLLEVTPSDGTGHAH